MVGPDPNAIGLAAVMGGLKKTPQVQMAAPYVGETAPGKKPAQVKPVVVHQTPQKSQVSKYSFPFLS
jgi:hypothetical protein